MSLVYHASALIEPDGTTTQRDQCQPAVHVAAGIYELAMDAQMPDAEALIQIQPRNGSVLDLLSYTTFIKTDDTTARIEFKVTGVGVDSRFGSLIWRFQPA
jgi:hypothetical protein